MDGELELGQLLPGADSAVAVRALDPVPDEGVVADALVQHDLAQHSVRQARGVDVAVGRMATILQPQDHPGSKTQL